MNILVDVEDVVLLNAYPWCWSGRYVIYNDGNRTLSLHREIMKAPSGKVVDHINGNTLDNRRINLRICSLQENLANSAKRITPCTSQYKGVSYDPARRHYKVYISKGGLREYLGSFRNEHDAAEAYNQAAIKLNGEFAWLNTIKRD